MFDYNALRQEVSAHLARTNDYASTRGEAMLHLSLELLDDDLCALVLKEREKPIYTCEDHSKLNISEVSGLKIIEKDYLGFIPVSGLENSIESADKIRFNHSFIRLAFERDALVDALHNMFARVREYEGHMINYESVNFGPNRPAQVSITGMDILRGFDSPALKCIPDVYHTTNEDTKIITLPEFSNGCKVFLPILDYFRADSSSE